MCIRSPAASDLYLLFPLFTCELLTSWLFFFFFSFPHNNTAIKESQGQGQPVNG